MRLYAGVTDRGWFDRLRRDRAEEVNFWIPSAPPHGVSIGVGEPFLFKLKGTPHVIGGAGFFVRYSVMPLSIAWACFEAKNGVQSFEELRAKIGAITHSKAPDPNVGCMILTQTEFFVDEEFIPLPEWSNPIVTGKFYDAAEPVGARLWASVQERFTWASFIDFSEQERYREQTILQRVGQGGFRVLVMDAYHRRCAITGEKTLPVLQASHIKPFSEDGSHAVSNGLLLRSDVHTLFDAGYITVTPDYKIEVSGRIKAEYENGKEYYALHGKGLIILPDSEQSRPSKEFLRWHNDVKFAA